MTQSDHGSQKKVSEKSHTTQTKSRKKNVSIGSSFMLGIVAIVIVGGIAGFFGVRSAVKNMSENTLVLAVAKIANMPAAEIDGRKISYADYIEDVITLKKFYENPPEGFAAVSQEEISNQVLSRLLINELVTLYSDELSVTVSDEDVKEVRDGLVSQFPSEAEAEQEMQFRYGWSLDAYTDKIIRPLLLEQKTIEAFAVSTDDKWSEYGDEQVSARHILVRVESEEEEESAREAAQAILDRILGGEDFGIIAAELEEIADEKQIVEELGWFGRGVMVPEFEDEAFNMSIGDSSLELVKTPFGFHIVHLDDIRDVRDFRSFLDAQLREVEIVMYINSPNPIANAVEQIDSSDTEHDAE